MLGQQGTIRVSQGFNTVSQGCCCGDGLDTILRVPEGGMLAMRLVKPTGGYTMGGAVGSTVGLATA